MSGDERDWTVWIVGPPVPEVPESVTVTALTCDIRPRLTRLPSGLWEAAPVQARSDPRRAWEGGLRVAAWARPKETEAWAYCALTHLSQCGYRSNDGNAHRHVYSAPRWRTSWVVYDPQLIRVIQSERPSTPYWHEQLSRALAEVAAWLNKGAQVPLA